jgi:hypothetical protein
MGVAMQLGSISYTTGRWLGFAATVLVLLVALWIGSTVPRPEAAGRPRRRLGKRLLSVFVGADGRVSTSRTVVFAWTAIVTFILTSLIFVEPKSWGDALKNLSPTYTLLVGGPYASLVLAKAAVATRVASGSLNKPPNEGEPRLSDLFNDDNGQTDMFDLQYVVFNVVAMVFVVLAFTRAGQVTGFPHIPEGLVLLTGGPAAVYLSNKILPSSGPSIFKVEPKEVRVGQTFTIVGQGLSTEPNAAVDVGGVTLPAEAVPTRSATAIVALAPDLGNDLGKPVNVAVGPTAFLSGALRVLGRVPLLYGLNRGEARVGDVVTAHGDWTAAEAEELVISIDQNVALRPQNPVAREATFAIPQLPKLAPPRSVPVRVKLGGEESQPVTLTVG